MRIRNEIEKMNSWSSRPTARVAVLGICILLGGSRGVAVGAPCTYVAQCDLETGECCTNCVPDYMCTWAGEGQGDDTVCLGEQACCLGPDDSYDCLSDVDAICCDDLGGVPAGEGTECTDPDDPCALRPCCLSVPGDFDDYCANTYFWDCVTAGDNPQPAGPPWCETLPDTDDDLIPDPCDNCPEHDNGVYDGTCIAGTIEEYCDEDTDCDTSPGSGDGECSLNQEDGDDDGVGDPCDNCPDDPNEGQEDQDSDGIGDVCDNCVNVANGPDQGTCMGGEYDGDPCDDDEDCGECDCNMNQEDCDDDGIGDVCEPNCDGDCYPDDCDPDIDNDGVPNGDDRCDYSPSDLDIEDEDENSPFYGTHRADLDGDCDVDVNDENELVFVKEQSDSSSCVNGQDKEDPLCPPCPPCPPCDSCCWQQIR